MADKNNQQQVSVNINPTTTPVLYTDNVLMNTNEDGVVLDIAQRLGSTSQAQVVARIGMSREHAKKLVTELGRLLAMTQGVVETGKKEN
ncbi:MAG TPA: hypothetical protein VF189_06130 [Patescibacteria group bacterium]